MNWIRVSRKRPCPICEKPDWCTIAPDGTAASCMRIQSDKPLANGGYLHRIGAQPAYKPPIRQFRPPPTSSIDFAAMIEAWRKNTPQNALETLADSLGVCTPSISQIGAARASQQSAWAFPMRDGDGKTVGIRLRGDNGDKWAVKGSKEGLFYPDSRPDDGIAVVCEGPTDTAAALTLGLWAVGRPSCMGAVEHVRRLCSRLCVTRIVVIADNDEPKPRPGGGWWQPGFDGAKKLVAAVAAVGIRFKLLAPPAKDIRAWIRSGATRSDFEFLADSQSWRSR
jgi:hypothetical protein